MGATVTLDYLVIGHAARDLVDGGFVTGGTVSYASRTALALGCRVGAVTSAGPDFDLSGVLNGVRLALVPAAQTTTFENLYTSDGRRQVLHGRAETLFPHMVPPDWRPTVVHVGPVARECPLELAQAFGGAFVGITPQGWMRQWDEAGRVRYCQWEDAEAWLARANAVVLSDQDVPSGELIAQYATQARVLAVTQGPAGCTVYAGDQVRSFPVVAAQEVDPTGAGDIFAAAFFHLMARRGDPWLAARFANCIAAASVTRLGLSGTPIPGEVDRCREALSNWSAPTW